MVWGWYLKSKTLARRAGLPYNSIEVLVLGNLTNTGTKPLNLKGSWIIVPFSMGVHTQFEGVWKRQTQPNSYFKVFCWCAWMWAFSFFKTLILACMISYPAWLQSIKTDV